MSSVAEPITKIASSGARRRAIRRLAVLSSLVLVGLAGFAALLMVGGINRQLDDVVHTYEVRKQARELTIALSEAASSQRGYVLTGDDSYLPSYERATASIGTRVQALITITQDDPLQVERVKGIVGSVSDKLAEMGRSVELVQIGRVGDARTLIRSGMGERAMDDVRSTLEAFIAEENVKLADRNRAIDWSRRWLVGAIIAALAGAAILAYTLFSRTQRQVSALAQNQTVLRTQNEALEAQVRERTQVIEEARGHAEHERQRVEALLQDTNHRIGNSLATVSSLLGLQLLRSQSPDVREALEAARARVHAVASAHRRLRLGGDLETVSADAFLLAVIEDLTITARNEKPVVITGEIEPIVIGARDATTIGILVGELVTNSLKHAFPDNRSGTVIVRLKRNEAGVPVLSVIDDGIGIAEDQTAGEGGLGSVIVKQLAKQFGGVPSYERRETGGLAVSLPLPGIEESANA